MKSIYAILAMSALVSAQTRDDIPSCAIPCIDDAVSSQTSCKNTDYACICKDFDSIQGAATGCVLSKCGTDVALNKVIPAVEALCKAQGTGGGSSSSTSATSEASSTEASSAEATSADTATSSSGGGGAAATTTTTAGSATATSGTAGTVSPSATVSPSSTTSGSDDDGSSSTEGSSTGQESSVPTGGAAVIGSVGGLAMAGLAVLAL
ncbi:CFEM domain [Geosmithia morbida]|uniref:CFEM domain n=1 Tax=Geosmithia morbida TaxID=1094350 RepID=A0A9P4YUH3_9HYPO|nr:CFEM domain [Geosmithia morbida]KAF4121918.1 CFEM domain [Geosmithia morbida]